MCVMWARVEKKIIKNSCYLQDLNPCQARVQFNHLTNWASRSTQIVGKLNDIWVWCGFASKCILHDKGIRNEEAKHLYRAQNNVCNYDHAIITPISLHCFTFCVIQPLWRVKLPFWNIIMPFRGHQKITTNIIAPLGVLKQLIEH